MRAATASLLVLLLAPAAGLAQSFRPATYCAVAVLEESGNPAPGHPFNLRNAFQPLVEKGEWRAAFDAVRRAFDAPAVPAGPRQRVEAQLDELRDALTAVDGVLGDDEPPLPPELVLTRFQIEFNNRLSAYRLFEHTPEPLVVSVEWGEPAVRTVCWTALALDSLLSSYGERGREVVSDAIGRHLQLWDTFHEHAYSQYPWESFLNGRWTVSERSWDPPRTQFVVMHPSLAVHIARPPDEGLRRIDVIAVEPFGVLRYAESRTTYLGASALVTVSSAQDPGFGALVHVGRIGKVGYVFRQRGPDGRNRRGPVFSLDLYKLLEGTPESVRRSKERLELMRSRLTQ